MRLIVGAKHTRFPGWTPTDRDSLDIRNREGTHVLPTVGQLERTDIVFWNGHISLAPAVVKPGAGRQPAWRAYARIAKALGLNDFCYGLDGDTATETQVLTAITANARGGPGIVLASVALDAGIISPRFYTTLVIAAVLTSQIAGAWLDYVLRKGWPLLTRDTSNESAFVPAEESQSIS